MNISSVNYCICLSIGTKRSLSSQFILVKIIYITFWTHTSIYKRNVYIDIIPKHNCLPRTLYYVAVCIRLCVPIPLTRSGLCVAIASLLCYKPHWCGAFNILQTHEYIFFFSLYFLVSASRVRQGGHTQRISQLTDLLQWLVMSNLKCYLIKMRTCWETARILSSVAMLVRLRDYVLYFWLIVLILLIWKWSSPLTLTFNMTR